MRKKKTEYNFEFVEVIAFLLKWKKQLLIITVTAAVLSYLASGPWFITPKYKSGCVFYPGTVNSVSAYLFYNTKDRARDLLEFGDEEVIEQYLQILHSGELQGRIIQKFNLAEHYKVSADNPQQMDIVYNKFNNNVTINRTNYNAIEITALDEDPKMAADIANNVMGMVDTIKTEVQRKVALQAHKIIEQAYITKRSQVDSIKLEMKELGKKGIYNSVEQSKGLSEIIGKGGNNAFTDKERKSLMEFGSDYIMLEELLKYEAENLADIRTRYEQSKIDVARELSNIFVVSYAYPPQTKAYPVRSIIVLIAALSAFLVASIALLLIEKYSHLKEHN